ncbi:hypothetical protein OAK79_03610, partial [Akkermansiaceae bacterium]|nr:hypothetical protein [Akkermansiaceae bacterium]
MRVAHIIPRLITESSGPSYSVPQLCAAQVRQGAEVELHLVGEAPANIPYGIKVFSYAPDRLTSIACGSR